MIKVLKAGIQSSIQDLGRVGFRHLGIPVSGAMDQYAVKLANTILGNKPNDSVLEIALGKSSFLFENEILICISGAKFSPKLNDEEMSMNTVIQIVKGDVLTFNKPLCGAWTYVAVKGGFLSPEILGSKSFYKNVTKYFLLSKGSSLCVNQLKALKTIKNASIKINNDYLNSKIINVYKGPEYDLLNDKQKERLKNTIFTISKDNSRMGYRLIETIENDLSSMLTSSVIPGTVQLTPSGTLIVLMRDCQVTGGYPRVLQLTDMAINQLAQKLTNDIFQFKLVNLDS